MLSAGRDVGRLRSLSVDLGVDVRTDFRPVLSRAEMRAAFLRSPVTLSIPRSDATAASLLEAMAAGSLPIVSDLPANRQLVTDGVNGLVVPIDDVAATASALERAVNDSALRDSAAGANRAWVRDQGSWESSVGRVVDLYRDVARRAGGC